MRVSTPGYKPKKAAQNCVLSDGNEIAISTHTPMPIDHSGADSTGNVKIRHGAGKILRERLVAQNALVQMRKAETFVNEMRDTAKQLATISEKFHNVAIGRGKLTEEIALEILDRLSRGETIKQIVKDPYMPTYQQIMKWVKTDPDFQAAYMSAQEFRMNVFADEILEIADDATGDIRLGFDKAGNVIPEVNVEAIQRSKLRIETRKYLMERYAKQTFAPPKEKTETKASVQGGVQIQINLPSNDRPITTEIIDV